jgi:pyrimidine operon attenuation protein/uracil phosphoribosyltransferase
MQVLLDETAVARGLLRVAGQIVERHQGVEGLVLVGVRRGGVAVAEALAEKLQEIEGAVPLGSVDITLYRDDASTALPNPRIGKSEIKGSLNDTRVIIVDDVLYTGRTIRAALDALLDYGRPRQIELMVLVDRPGRELPIQADYRVLDTQVDRAQRVDLLRTEAGLRVIVQPFSAPSVPPASL